ncbi:PA14 domain-containing protein, partial [Spirosoma soli]
HYSASGSFIDRIMYLQNNYSCYIDQNNPTRVFAQFLEFGVDYAKPLAANNGSWTLLKNWRATLPASYFEFLSINHTFITNIFKDVLTMPNGRTYGFLRRFTDNKWVLVELPKTGPLRVTNITFDAQYLYTYHITSDGSLKQSINNLNGTSGTVNWQTRPLTGFDANNDPIWGAPQDYATAPINSGEEPINWYGGHSRTGETTSSNVMITFDNGKVKGDVGGGYHLGGIRVRNNKWLWKTAHATSPTYTGNYPDDGAYDVGNSVEYAGGDITVLERNIFWNYHGEFWKNSQVNKWQHVYDNGLLVGIFGKTGPEAVAEAADKGPVPGMAGNVLSGTVLKAPNGNVYLYHAEESGWSGIHRWRIDGLNTIQEQVIDVIFKASSTHGLLGQYVDGRDLNNLNVKAVRIDKTVNFSEGNLPSGTSLFNTNNFSVKWTGFIQPTFSQTYTFYTNTDQGVRLWVDGKLLIDKWNNTNLSEYNGSLVLQANQRYAIRLEYQGGKQLSLSWASSNLPKQVIDSQYLYPNSAADASSGVDLLEGLQTNSVLTDGLYGWRRTPTEEDNTDREWKYWTAKTNIKTYQPFRSPDLYMYFRQEVGTYKVTRDLGSSTNSLSSWKFTGVVNQDGNFFNIDEGQNRNGGSVIEVLDTDGKVITRVYPQVFLNRPNAPSAVYANSQVIAQGEYFRELGPIFSQSQPLEISMINGTATIKYGPYNPVTVPVFDSSANWQRPKTLQFRFWGNGYNLSRIIDVERMYFYASNSPSPSIDLDLSLQSSKRIVHIGETVSLSLRIRNTYQASLSDKTQARWTCRLPDNLEVIGSGLTNADNVLMGLVQNLGTQTDTTFIFSARPLAAGKYKLAAQITASLPDLDSTPNSGTADGEDDTGVVDFRTFEPGETLFSSPNPEQRPLPPVASSRFVLDSSKVDLNLTVSLTNRTPKINEIITCSLAITNAGRVAANGVLITNQLPDGLAFVEGAGWSANGTRLSYTVGSITPGATAKVTFQARVLSSGYWVNQAQVYQATPADIDSTPGNGFTNGEDDQAQVDLRVK